MAGKVHSLHRPADVDGMGLIEEKRHARMVAAAGPIDLPGLRFAVRPVEVFDVENREQGSLGVPKAEHGARGQILRRLLGHVKHDRYRPERTVGQTHVLADGLIVQPIHEPGQGHKAAIEQQLEVTELSLGQVPGGGAKAGPNHLGTALGSRDKVAAAGILAQLLDNHVR